MSQFKNDLNVERIISLWTEENYFKSELNLYSYKRCESAVEQNKGKDAAIKNNLVFKDDFFHNIDEKAASSYIRTDLTAGNLSTFAFELDCKRHGSPNPKDRVPGWLFGDKYSLTEYYLLSWVWAENNHLSSASQLKKIKCLLVSKKAIQDYVATFGIDKTTFMEEAKKTRNNKQGKIFLSKYDKKTPNLQYSKKLEELPVNIIISEYMLKKLAIDCFEVTQKN
ncbi:hypothetical protein [Carnobacterium mobile]|uniref:hypothetical protein n=1 Tax=Carnobacterium mobile TaxID=2750 RepID=UPI001868F913|nr:hypothetical protein [Carnobacterium mobile]